MSRRSIVIVAGKLDDVRMLDLFEPLTAKSDVTVCVIQNEDILSHYRTAMKIKVFRDIPDMPGYARGLEDEIGDADLIIAIECSKLATFQAVRAAVKAAKPVLVYVNETIPFAHADNPSIRAIQMDVFENASGFIASSAAAKEMLMIEGVQADKIWEIPPAIAKGRFSYSAKRREKFRNYINLGSDDFLILFRDELIPANQPAEILKALRILKTKTPELISRVKVLYASNGALSEELKYQAFDQGFGKQVFFLHQSVEPFVHDLYCASDMLISFKGSQPRSLKRWILEAASCRVLPVLGVGSLMTRWLDSLYIPLMEENGTEVANKVLQLVSEPQSFEEKKAQVCNFVQEHYDQEKLAGLLDDLVDENLRGVPYEIKRRKNDFEDLYKRLESQLDAGNYPAALPTVEDLLLRAGNDARLKSDLQRAKGDALFSMNQLDPASQAYAEAVQWDDRNWKAFLGLGHISLASHANEEAVKFFKKVLARDPNNSKAMLGFGMIYRRLKMNDEAIYWLQKCVAAAVGDKKAIIALAQACLESDNYPAAIAVLERTLETVGEEPSLTMALGQIYMREGNVERGREMIAKALSVAGKLPEAG